MIYLVYLHLAICTRTDVSTISGAFESEDMNAFPMKPEEGYLDLVSISSHGFSSLGILSPVILIEFFFWYLAFSS